VIYQVSESTGSSDLPWLTSVFGIIEGELAEDNS